jgi:large subunit ribosomal protein L6
MALGYSHPVVFQLPKVVAAKVDKNKVVLTSADRDVLGQTAAKIRELRPPEPYKGKGVKYAEERIRRKVGKAGA